MAQSVLRFGPTPAHLSQRLSSQISAAATAMACDGIQINLENINLKLAAGTLHVAGRLRWSGFDDPSLRKKMGFCQSRTLLRRGPVLLFVFQKNVRINVSEYRLTGNCRCCLIISFCHKSLGSLRTQNIPLSLDGLTHAQMLFTWTCPMASTRTCWESQKSKILGGCLPRSADNGSAFLSTPCNTSSLHKQGTDKCGMLNLEHSSCLGWSGSSSHITVVQEPKQSPISYEYILVSADDQRLQPVASYNRTKLWLAFWSGQRKLQASRDFDRPSSKPRCQPRGFVILRLDKSGHCISSSKSRRSKPAKTASAWRELNWALWPWLLSHVGQPYCSEPLEMQKGLKDCAHAEGLNATNASASS